MKGKSITGERDREATEKRLLDTIGKMIAEDGFEKIGINAIATQSGVSKIDVYKRQAFVVRYLPPHHQFVNVTL